MENRASNDLLARNTQRLENIDCPMRDLENKDVQEWVIDWLMNKLGLTQKTYWHGGNRLQKISVLLDYIEVSKDKDQRIGILDAMKNSTVDIEPLPSDLLLLSKNASTEIKFTNLEDIDNIERIESIEFPDLQHLNSMPELLQNLNHKLKQA
ncbi:hypothetical protein ROZALSC1DRAFT_30185, partial [Rozella allomycis CSF55]